jgi:alpha-galactosidase
MKRRILGCLVMVAGFLAAGVSPAQATAGSVIAQGNIKIVYQAHKGTADVYWRGAKRINSFSSAVKLDGRLLSTKDYGGGCRVKKLTVTCERYGLPTFRQKFTFDGPDYFLIQVELESRRTLNTNQMIPLLVDSPGGVDIGTHGDRRMLLVPVDNDHWVRYESKPINEITPKQRSFEVTTVFDDTSRRGFVFGSIDHDTWKSGITAQGRRGKLDRLEVTAGLTDYQYDYGTADNKYQFNREILPHRPITGTTVSSPRMLVGYFEDWRTGMETYGRANAKVTGIRTWDKGTPFGYNSWGGLGAAVSNPDLMTQTSDFIADKLPEFRGDDKPYVGIDSYWDALLEPQWQFESPGTSWKKLEQYVAHVRANGQEPALYFQPFTNFWLDGIDQQIGGTALCDGCPNQTMRQLSLKANGNPMQLDNGWALDPTNPGVLNRSRIALTKFRELGVRYVKMDFFTHGMLEADGWYDQSVHTGLQAFHKGMRQVAGWAGEDMFIDLAISPLFMGQYGHARRISCDVHGSMNNWHEKEPQRFQKSTEYLLNSLTYGWWLDEVYTYNDADHIQFGNYYYDTGNNAKLFDGTNPAEPRIWPENYNRARVTSAVITGVYLISDDFSAQGDPVLKARAEKFLRNKEINEVARIGRSFRPVDGGTGFQANSMYVLRNGNDTYLAVFNFDKSGPRGFRIDPDRIGLQHRNTFRELWSGKTFTARGHAEVTVPAEDAVIYRISS